MFSSICIIGLNKQRTITLVIFLVTGATIVALLNGNKHITSILNGAMTIALPGLLAGAMSIALPGLLFRISVVITQ